MRKPPSWLWWLTLLLLWLLATAADRAWLSADQRLPAWDQADYLNSAVDHGHALGVLPGGTWQGWQALLDLSPKIPPLSSLVSGTVMAFSGEEADAASWVLSLWHGLLLLVVALWGRQLHSAGLGLLASALVALAPALAGLRVDFTLDMPLTASCTLALWLLWRWQRPEPFGGRWGQALAAAAAIAAALLIKQSALLMLTAPALWAAVRSQSCRTRRWQCGLAISVVLLTLLPWLHHNWITTLGGTERAVVQSGAREGDPGSLDPRSLIWYPRIWPEQLGVLSLGLGLVGLGRLTWLHRRPWPPSLPAGWRWLLGTVLSGWLLTSLSPNKDPRYIAPLLPLLALMLARGWWELGQWLHSRGPAGLAPLGLTAGLLALTTASTRERIAAVHNQPESLLPQLIGRLRHTVGTSPTTLLVLPSETELNQHNTTALGRLNGGAIVGREPSKSAADNPLTLRRGEWFVLSSQPAKRRATRQLAASVRSNRGFHQVGAWQQLDGSKLELWGRRPGAARAERFDADFIRLARGMENGPSGLATVFEVIGPEHQLDGHFLYQQRIRRWAEQRLHAHPNDQDALWSLALLAILQNRPDPAAVQLARLERISPDNPWPAAYRSAVQLIDWQPWAARNTATSGLERVENPVLKALRDLASGLGGDPSGWLGLKRSLPPALREWQQ